MAQRYQTLRGTHDLLPDVIDRWQFVEATARQIFGQYGFDEIRTPVLESTELFVRSVGESTDIVRKEMYSFERGKSALTLRPENTAAVARAFVQHAMGREVASGYPVRLFYAGPMFRYERPQAGRQRQFHQIGAEVLGAAEPLIDAETLKMLDRFLEALGLEERTLALNSLGDGAERAAYRETLRRFVEPRLGDDEELRRLWSDNPLRLFDSKHPRAAELMDGAPTLLETLGSESREHFERVQRLLDGYGLRYRIEPRLVRGLDYYQRTVFEVLSGELGAQNAILGGGRYDGLVGELGGGDVPGFGFAIGLERLLLLMDPQRAPRRRPDVALVPLGEAGFAAAPAMAERLRDGDLSVLMPATTRPMGAQLKRATKAEARFAMFVGEQELAAGRFGLKDLGSGEQVDCSEQEVIERVHAGRRDPVVKRA